MVLRFEMLQNGFGTECSTNARLSKEGEKPSKYQEDAPERDNHPSETSRNPPTACQNSHHIGTLVVDLN